VPKRVSRISCGIAIQGLRRISGKFNTGKTGRGEKWTNEFTGYCSGNVFLDCGSEGCGKVEGVRMRRV